MDCGVMPPAGSDVADHLWMEQVADCRNEERGGNLILVEQPKDTRQSIDRAIFAARQDDGCDITACQRRRHVVYIKAERHSDSGAVRPGSRTQSPAGSYVNLSLELIHA